MITIETSDVLMYAPELSNENASTFEVYIDLAKSFVFENKWERKYKQAVCLLTAHFLTLKNRASGGSGPITQESVGELSVSYGAVSDKANELLTTNYGTMYFQLRKTLKITPLVV